MVAYMNFLFVLIRATRLLKNDRVKNCVVVFHFFLKSVIDR